MSKKIVIGCVVALLVLGVALWLVGGSGGEQEVEHLERASSMTKSPGHAQTGKTVRKSGTRDPSREEDKTLAADGGDLPGEQEKSEKATISVQGETDKDEEEALVKEFDSLTDKWVRPTGKSVSMEDIQRFVERFRKLPKARKSECLQRALNLVPDENVMLLAGVLMDKTLDKEYLAMVYNDVLNRDEDVKEPVLLQIFKDREHPCWADTAWVLDVTGKLPATTVNKK